MSTSLECEVEIQGNKPCLQLAWCPGSNYIAMSMTDVYSEYDGISVLNPSNFEVTSFVKSAGSNLLSASPTVMKYGLDFMQEHALLSIPGGDSDADRQITCLQWSPPDSKRQLLAAATSGKCMIWSQTSATNCTDSLITSCDWQCNQTFHLSSAPGATHCITLHQCRKMWIVLSTNLASLACYKCALIPIGTNKLKFLCVLISDSEVAGGSIVLEEAHAFSNAGHCRATRH